MAGQNRIAALDALRGLAILLMVLSGMGPYGIMPAWMYHAQLPPPEHNFNPGLPGLTWVDLVFPLFLFALGAAIPLAYNRRLENGENTRKLIWRTLERGFLLGSFAIFLQHIRPLTLNPVPDLWTWLQAVLGFLLLFLMYTRFPAEWKPWFCHVFRIGGWSAAIIYLILVRFPDGSGCSLNRSDIILVVLTNAAVFGGIIWIFTRERLMVRLGIMAILVALRVSAPLDGWVKVIWDFTPVPWIYKFYYLQYLLIVLPGTIVGDILISWKNGTEEKNRSNSKMTWIGILLSILVISNLVGLQARWVEMTFAFSMILLAIIYYVWRRDRIRSDDSMLILLRWTVFLLIIGFAFEPFEGGIKKDRSTLSYYFISTGLSVSIFSALTIWIDILKKQRWFDLLIVNGKNPMIAYVGFGNLVWPVLAISGLDDMIRSVSEGPWSGFLRSILYTLLVALMVKIFTHYKLFWRT